MRISDWSSDVFSSDLDRVVVGLAGATVVEGGLAIGLDHPGAVDRPRVEVLEHLLDGRVLAGLLLLVPVGAVEDGRGDEGGRSEEHTSELQSLMRISYAVFCLKKKR